MFNELNDCNFIFKSKHNKLNITNYFTDEKKRNTYLEMMKYLDNESRFTYYDNNTQLESLIANADLIISMGMNSPTTIALILRKEAAYYDTTGNSMHPFTQYKNKVLFDDKRLLIDHIKDILENRKSVFDYIDPDLLNQYEPFRDSNALERLIQAISKETGIV
jgi:polysaccharide biosynthesis PFTS motif protein